jgi:O-antigen ligase
MIILAIILGVLALSISWYKVAWGAYFLALILPTYVGRFSIVGLPSTLLEAVIAGVLVGSILAFTVRREPFPKVSKFWILAASSWLVIGIFGVIVAQDHIQALGLFRAYILEPLLIIPIWLVVLRQEKSTMWLWRVFALQLIVIGVVSVCQRIGILASLAPWINEHPPRVTSIFAYPNAMALYVAPLTAASFGILVRFYSDLRREKWLWITATFFGFLSMIFALSRGALIAFGVCVVITGAWSNKKVVWWSICGLLILMLGVIPATRQEIQKVIIGKDVSTDVRQVLWKGTWRMLKARPLTGAGLGAFPEIYNKYRLPQHVELLQYPHNLALNVWSELGLPGLVASLGGILWLTIAVFRKLKEKNAWVVPAFMAWVAILIHGLVDVPYFKNDLAVLTILLFIFAIRPPPNK